LGFARYNDFANAQAVKLGWVIVRDICNMFFIVILLISAFSTIIPWDPSLHYKSVVPKLLLMAILINFSRTLIQVLIDFSQVVMLTFVNAFRAAGAGNFVNAFKISKLLDMREELGPVTATATTYSTIFVSFLLALVLVIIANGVMIIMTAFVLARIIGLWVALIFSPAAFLVKALPSSLQSGLGSFSGKYWSRLGGMLTGGPVVMFFIYLTFAILQTPATPTADTASPVPAGQAAAPTPPASTGLAAQVGYRESEELRGGNTTAFLTTVGNADDVASFIVAVALMLMALEAATEAATATHSAVGKFASSVSSGSKALAFGAATVAASSPWLAAKMGYRKLDQHTDITGKASNIGLRLANKIPLPFVGDTVRQTLMKGMTMNKGRAETKASEFAGAMKGKTPDQIRVAQGALRSGIIATNLGRLRNAVAGGMVNILDKGATPGSGLGRVGRAIAGSASRVVDFTNEHLQGISQSQGDQRALMAVSGQLAGDAVLAEDRENEAKTIKARLKREDRDRRAREPDYKGRSEEEL
ncbi:MAG: hypothetical protein AABX69_04955, partial [Nanoarchaeota archaeon]